MITLTENAAAKVEELIKAEGDDDLVLRVAVRPGGCNGFSYEIFFDSDVDDKDVKVTYGDIDVVVDPDSAPMLDAAILDYSDGLQGTGFSFTNPRATSTCGCGDSFS